MTNGGSSETYYSSAPTVFSNLGFTGYTSAALPGIATTLKYIPSLPELRALSILDIYVAAISSQESFSSAILPPGFLAGLGFDPSMIDSFRLRINILRNDIVDANGALTIPGGTYDVLREKRIDYRSSQVDIHTSMGWIPSSNWPGLGTDTIVNYRFISGIEKEPIAILQMDPSQSIIQQVEYKDNGLCLFDLRTVSTFMDNSIYDNALQIESSVIMDKNNVTFKAEESVKLFNGFEVTPNKVFNIEIKPCIDH
ncbi:MAG: hypothetical protein IPL46_18640 [Saprospiraceae bacterium]|nr:hypothetical protein [Saprospiraceae bacterium]